MGSGVSPNPKCWQLRTPYSLCHSRNSPRAVPSSPLRNVTDNNGAMPCRLVYGSSFSGSRSPRVQRVKRACSAHFDDFPPEEIMNLIQEVAKKVDLPREDDDENDKGVAYAVSENTQNMEPQPGVSDRGSTEQFWTMKPAFLEPSVLGIQPEPPNWPERNEILRLSFERKLNSVEIPLSIRIIKKKLQLQKGFEEAKSELTQCSLKKTFSSMLSIIHELQNYVLQIRESMYSEGLQGVMIKQQRVMNASFVWLFQHVFWNTPSLMVHVMVLLANFSVFSISNNTIMAVTPSSMTTEVPSLTGNKNKRQHSQVDTGVDQDECGKELTEEEETLWSSMLEEASRLQKELGTETLDHETTQRFVAPLSVELQGDKYEEFVKTELYYRRHLRREPYNSLLLSNYAQFLYLVVHDLDGAEKYFKLAVLVEPPDGEAFSRYADFLWLVRKDHWAAELRYLQALDADPGSTYYSSKYASFLWSTGGDDTCFPLEYFDNLQL